MSYKYSAKSPPRHEERRVDTSIFDVLISIKALHGTREGRKGSSIEDIVVYMIKEFRLDGDVMTQVSAALKCGEKKCWILKKDGKYSLIQPAAAIYQASDESKDREIRRIQTIFPMEWNGADNKKDEDCTESQPTPLKRESRVKSKIQMRNGFQRRSHSS